jgi:hypothetical protein
MKGTVGEESAPVLVAPPTASKLRFGRDIDAAGAIMGTGLVAVIVTGTVVAEATFPSRSRASRETFATMASPPTKLESFCFLETSYVLLPIWDPTIGYANVEEHQPRIYFSL